MIGQGIAKQANPKAGQRQGQKLSWSSLRRSIFYDCETSQAKQLKCLLLRKDLLLVLGTRGLQEIARGVVNLAG